MIKKLLISIFSIFILMGQMPPNIIIDENEKDIRIKPNIAGTEVVLSVSYTHLTLPTILLV